MRKEKKRKDEYIDRTVNYTCYRKKSQVFINCRNGRREKERSNQWIFRQHNKMKEYDIQKLMITITISLKRHK